MKKFYGNQHVRIFKFKKWFKETVNTIIATYKKTILMVALIEVVLWALTGAIIVGRTTVNPQIVRAEVKVEVPVEVNAPIMDKIMSCESGGKHYAKNGQVVFKANTNGTVDIGIMQINSVWSVTATKMGYDLTKESDNKAFGMWLYKNKGTEPWYSSKACWNK